MIRVLKDIIQLDSGALNTANVIVELHDKFLWIDAKEC